MAAKKIYLVKNLSPWMIDELLAFADQTSYSLLLLRAPDKKYHDQLTSLRNKGVEIIDQPYRFKLSLHKLLVAIQVILRYPGAFLAGYSAVVGWKSLAWYLRLNQKYVPLNASLHAQFATQAALIAMFLKLQHKTIRYSFTFHAYDIYFNNRWFKPLVNHSEHAFSISDYNITYVGQKFKGLSAHKLVVSRLGAFCPQPSSTPLPADKAFTIGFLGRFVEKKGVSYLLSAMAILQREGVDVDLVLAGDGPLLDSYRQQIQDDALGRIKLIGSVQGSSKDAFFRNIDAFVMPSVRLPNDMDGIPVVLMEAVSYGLPVIGTDVSGMKEICINDVNGKLIPERDSLALASAIRGISSNKEEYAKFQGNASRVFEQYNIVTNSTGKLRILSWL